jgi:hypothetical protein
MSEPRDTTDRAMAVFHAFDNIVNPFKLEYDGQEFVVSYAYRLEDGQSHTTWFEAYRGTSRWEALEQLHNHAGGH